jgi:hypothetical protein
VPINFNTNHVIIIHYRPGAGGKFIHGCLALNENILHLQPLFALNKLKKRWDEKKSFKITKTLLDLTKKHQTLIEFGHGKDVYGFQYDDNMEEIKNNANKFFQDLTNQTKFYFFLTNHDKKNYDNFINAKNIFLMNDGIVMKKRKRYYFTKEQNSTNNFKNYKNYFLFDMSTIENEMEFIKEIDRTTEWLNLKEIKNKNLINTLRVRWLENFKIKIKKRNPDWNQKGYYKGHERA